MTLRSPSIRVAHFIVGEDFNTYIINVYMYAMNFNIVGEIIYYMSIIKTYVQEALKRLLQNFQKILKDLMFFQDTINIRFNKNRIN